MSDLQNQNAAAAQQALEEFELRLQAMEKRIEVLTNLVQTQSNEMMALKQSNNLALAQLRGTGATSNGNDN